MIKNMSNCVPSHPLHFYAKQLFSYVKSGNLQTLIYVLMDNFCPCFPLFMLYEASYNILILTTMPLP